MQIELGNRKLKINVFLIFQFIKLLNWDSHSFWIDRNMPWYNKKGSPFSCVIRLGFAFFKTCQLVHLAVSRESLSHYHICERLSCEPTSDVCVALYEYFTLPFEQTSDVCVALCTSIFTLPYEMFVCSC